jgi:hypothetical protein
MALNFCAKFTARHLSPLRVTRPGQGQQQVSPRPLCSERAEINSGHWHQLQQPAVVYVHGDVAQ